MKMKINFDVWLLYLIQLPVYNFSFVRHGSMLDAWNAEINLMAVILDKINFMYLSV